ncbi:MAG: hypothetical protein FWG64_13665 [Firmicutes bacterium]|nr:hypothetical protein [Bacillota bacterium]
MDYDDNFEMEEEYDFSKGVRGIFAEANALTRKRGKYQTLLFDRENNKVTISEIKVGTREVLSRQVYDIDKMPKIETAPEMKQAIKRGHENLRKLRAATFAEDSETAIKKLREELAEEAKQWADY